MATAVRDAIPTPNKGTRFYRPELDALRLFAFLMVFLHHLPILGNKLLNPIHGAFALGMHIFFVLSAYLITELLLREQEKTGTIRIKAFFMRRILRIWPLYFLAIGIGYVVGHVIPQYRVGAEALPYFLLLGANIYFASPSSHMGVILPLWSISVEEQFYLLIPAAMKYGGRKALWISSVAAVIAAYACLAVLGGLHANPNRRVWGNSFVQFQFFAAGTLLALALHEKRWAPDRAARWAIIVTSLGSVVAVFHFCPLHGEQAISTAGLFAGYMISLLASSAILLAFLGATISIPEWLLHLGRISFGLYVFHFLAVDLTVRAYEWNPGWHEGHFTKAVLSLVALALTVVLANASYYGFEKRFLQMKQRFASVKSKAQ